MSVPDNNVLKTSEFSFLLSPKDFTPWSTVCLSEDSRELQLRLVGVLGVHGCFKAEDEILAKNSTKEFRKFYTLFSKVCYICTEEIAKVGRKKSSVE